MAVTNKILNEMCDILREYRCKFIETDQERMLYNTVKNGNLPNPEVATVSRSIELYNNLNNGDDKEVKEAFVIAVHRWLSGDDLDYLPDGFFKKFVIEVGEEF